MKQKMSLGQIYRANDALERFSKNEFRINESFRILKMKNILVKEFEAIDAQRTLLIKKYIPEGSNLNRVPDDKLAEFQQDFNNFLFSEIVEIDVPAKLSADSIMNSDIKISPTDLVDLWFFIDNIEKYIDIVDDEKEATNIEKFPTKDNTEPQKTE